MIFDYKYLLFPVHCYTIANASPEMHVLNVLICCKLNLLNIRVQKPRTPLDSSTTPQDKTSPV